MTENVNPTSSPVSMVKARLMIRVGYKSLSFSVVDGSCEEGVRYEPYTVKSGISMAANLRQAFLDSELLLSMATLLRRATLPRSSRK